MAKLKCSKILQEEFTKCISDKHPLCELCASNYLTNLFTATCSLCLATLCAEHGGGESGTKKCINWAEIEEKKQQTLSVLIFYICAIFFVFQCVILYHLFVSIFTFLRFFVYILRFAAHCCVFHCKFCE